MNDIESFIKGKHGSQSDHTKKNYTYILMRFDRYLKTSGGSLDNFSRSDVQFYIRYLEQKKELSPRSVAAEFAAISSFCEWKGQPELCRDIRMTRPMPVLHRAPKALDRNTRNRIIRESDRKADKRDYALVMLMLGCGLRVSEVSALNRDDIAFSERKGILTVRHGKENRQRDLPVPSDVRYAIETYLAQRTDNHEALFISKRMTRLSVRAIEKSMEAYDLNPHRLRHTFIKALKDKQYSDALVMSLSGHTDPKMVAWYSQPSEEDRENAVNNLYD